MNNGAEIEFLSRRLREEYAAIGAAKHVRVRIIHGQLATAYSTRLAEISDEAQCSSKAA